MTAANEAHPAEVTHAMRDYLGAIDHLGDGQMAVTTQRIAQHLGISCPSVTNMIKRLHGRGLVTYEPYHGVHLTDTGRYIAAADIKRRHLVERYLVEKLGYARNAARMEAARLEGAVTCSMEARIEAALRNPMDVSPGTPPLTPLAAAAVIHPAIAADKHPT